MCLVVPSSVSLQTRPKTSITITTITKQHCRTSTSSSRVVDRRRVPVVLNKWREMGGVTDCRPAWTGVRYRKLAHRKPTDGCWSFSCSGCGSVQMLQVNAWRVAAGRPRASVSVDERVERYSVTRLHTYRYYDDDTPPYSTQAHASRVSKWGNGPLEMCIIISTCVLPDWMWLHWA